MVTVQDSLRGKCAMITGASRGIGFGIAQIFAEHGMRLVVNARTQEHLQKCLELGKRTGVEVIGAPGDVGDPATADRMTAAAMEHFGQIDVLVNCAGIIRDAMMHKMTDQQFDDVIRVNLNGAYYLMNRVSPIMRRQKSGRILSISSIAWKGNIGQVNYCASKAGLIGMTRAAAFELARYGVTCNVITPGFTHTEMTQSMPEEARKAMEAKIPMGHAITPEDIGYLAAYLASDQARYITGQVISIDGGLVL